MNNYFLKKSTFFLCLMFILTCFCQRATAHPDGEISLLRMYYSENKLVVTPSRNPKPLSQTAENITVITCDEIESINAHTLSDILNYIPGIQMDIRGTLGINGNINIQGSAFKHVLLLIDGVILNYLMEGAADLSLISVQNIARIEIIKGPASSSWGSSLGGVINIITKSAGNRQKTTGAIVQTGGEKKTLDSRVELSSQTKNGGFYLFAGNLTTQGFRPSNAFDTKQLYTKLRWNLTDSTNLLFTLGYNEALNEYSEYPEYKLFDGADSDHLFSTLGLNSFLNSKCDVSLTLRTSKKNFAYFLKQLDTGITLDDYSLRSEDLIYSGTFLLRGKYQNNHLVFGVDFEDGTVESESIAGGKQTLEKKAVFVNDTITLDRFSFVPGIRFDNINTHGDFVSPSIGISWGITEKTIFRAYLARGFNIAPLSRMYADTDSLAGNPNLLAEKIDSSQAGIESTSLNYVWFKTSFFKHKIKHPIEGIFSETLYKKTAVNTKQQKRQGMEVEIKTCPVYNTSLVAGYVLLSAKSIDTGKRLEWIPRHTFDIGVHHHHKKSFHASLKGHYIQWDESYYNGKKGFIWNLHLKKQIYTNKEKAMEAFLSIHNIFDDEQYLIDVFKNARRWLEGGIRCKF